jgi:phosphonopyruvate decarboxylase
MLDPRAFFEALKEAGIEFFAGVPDSLLKAFCAYVTDHASPGHHVIAANEGGAVALGVGYHLQTGGIPLIYMQNSGLGNAVNPLLSLVDPDVYAVPMLLLIGWRGEPGVGDEPQHVKQGRVMTAMLAAMEIPFTVLEADTVSGCAAVTKAVEHARRRGGPCAMVVRKGTLGAYELESRPESQYEMSREDAVRLIAERIDQNAIIVSTTGMTSRELFAFQEERGTGHGRDFLTVGGMGHCSQIALGIAMNADARDVFCLDGDGAVIMHMGSLAIIGTTRLRCFNHIVINNGVHDSVGGQPTVGFDIDVVGLARSLGYDCVLRATTSEEVCNALAVLRGSDGPSLLEIRVGPGHRPDVGRPTTTPKENKYMLMETLSGAVARRNEGFEAGR